MDRYTNFLRTHLWLVAMLLVFTATGITATEKTPTETTVADKALEPKTADIQQQMVELERKMGKLENETIAEILKTRTKTVDWWLVSVGVFLTIFGIIAVLAGYVSFKRFSKIETEAKESAKQAQESAKQAQKLVEEIEEKRDYAGSIVESMENSGAKSDESPFQARRVDESTKKPRKD